MAQVVEGMYLLITRLKLAERCENELGMGEKQRKIGRAGWKSPYSLRF